MVFSLSLSYCVDAKGLANGEDASAAETVTTPATLRNAGMGCYDPGRFCESTFLLYSKHKESKDGL
jgi:hypothetical protein